MTSPEPADSERWGGWFTVVVVAFSAWCAWFILRTAFDVAGRVHFSLFDDAMISMRYARNLAHGHGLGWNVHGPRVEGYTNFLWTLYMALLHLLPVPERLISVLVEVTSAALLVLNLAVVKAIAERLAPGSRVVAVWAVVLTATYFPLSYWALRGMEVGFMAFLLSASVLLALRLRDGVGVGAGGRDLAWLAVAMAAALLVRTDAVVSCAVLVAFVWLAAGSRRAVVLAATVVGTLVALTVFRIAYYGDALPNTYYLKVTGVATGVRVSTGWEALTQITVVHLSVVVVVALVAIAAFRRTHELGIALLAALVLGQAAYSVYVGGDAWELFSIANRYLCVAMPELLLLAAIGIGELARGDRRSARLLALVCGGFAACCLALAHWGRAERAGVFFRNFATLADVARFRGALVAGAAVLLVTAAALWVRGGAVVGRRPMVVAVAVGALVVVGANQMAVTNWWRHGGFSVDLDAHLAEAGEQERAAIRPGGVVAVWFAGNSAYFSHRESLDLLGKSDHHIARIHTVGIFNPGHSKYDLAYSIKRLRPDVVDFGPTPMGFTPEDLTRYRAWGYDAVNESVLVRRGTTRVDRTRLAAVYDGHRLDR